MNHVGRRGRVLHYESWEGTQHGLRPTGASTAIAPTRSGRRTFAIGLRSLSDQGEWLDGARNVGRARTPLTGWAGIARTSSITGTDQRKDASDNEVGRPDRDERYDDVLCNFRHGAHPSRETGQQHSLTHHESRGVGDG
jgi:hypothetical protein